ENGRNASLFPVAHDEIWHKRENVIEIVANLSRLRESERMSALKIPSFAATRAGSYAAIRATQRTPPQRHWRRLFPSPARSRRGGAYCRRQESRTTTAP